MILEILSNYILQTQSTRTRNPRFFQITSKIREAIPEILSNYFENKTRYPRDSLRPLQNKTEGVPEILSKYFKKKALGVPEILSNYFKNKRRDLRDSFKLLQKQDKESPRFFQLRQQ